MTHLIRFTFVSFFLICFFSTQVSADIYTWIDENGVRHYTNVIGDRHLKSRNIEVLKKKKDAKPVTLRTKTIAMKHWGHEKKISVGSYSRYDHYISQAAFEHQVDPWLIKAVIKTESNFNQYAVSSQGAQGLMQLMPMTAMELKVNNPYDARQNINGGTRYLRQLMDCYKGDLRLSLAAYNAGPSLVTKLGKVPRIPETREYVRRVLNFYDIYRQGDSVSSSINVRKLVTVN